MLVAGIVITIAFILTALTLSQLSSLERISAAEKPAPIGDEWRFLHDRLATNLQTAISSDMTNATLTTTTFPAIAATFRNIEAEKGYDVVIRLAGATTGTYNHTEASLVTNGNYHAGSDDGTYTMTNAYDGVDDGILWQKPCRDPSAPSTGCIGGVYVYVHMTDATSTMEESIFYAVNSG